MSQIDHGPGVTDPTLIQITIVVIDIIKPPTFFVFFKENHENIITQERAIIIF